MQTFGKLKMSKFYKYRAYMIYTNKGMLLASLSHVLNCHGQVCLHNLCASLLQYIIMALDQWKDMIGQDCQERYFCLRAYVVYNKFWQDSRIVYRYL